MRTLVEHTVQTFALQVRSAVTTAFVGAQGNLCRIQLANATWRSARRRKTVLQEKPIFPSSRSGGEVRLPNLVEDRTTINPLASEVHRIYRCPRYVSNKKIGKDLHTSLHNFATTSKLADDNRLRYLTSPSSFHQSTKLTKYVKK